jgi:hypothetical protein
MTPFSGAGNPSRTERFDRSITVGSLKACRQPIDKRWIIETERKTTSFLY